MKESDRQLSYEEIHEAILEEAEDFFRADDISNTLDGIDRPLTHQLNSMAESDSYQIWRTNSSSRYFTTLGDIDLHENPGTVIDGYRKVRQTLSEFGELSKDEVREIGLYAVDTTLNITNRMERAGQLQHMIRNNPNTVYIAENETYKWTN